jgi:23S rRNA (uracil1939-C5)-methyltransferase
VGRLAGQTVFVRGGAPGDRVRVRIDQRRNSYLRGSIESLVRPGADRVEAPCQFFGRCGGCQWQHVSYEGQIAAKDAILAHALRRVAVGRLWPMVRTDRPYGYRRRARFGWRFDGCRLLLGFREGRSAELVQVDACTVLAGPLGVALAEMRRSLPTITPGPASGSLVLLAGDDGGTHFSLRVDQGQVPRSLAPLVRHPLVGGVLLDEKGQRLGASGAETVPLALDDAKAIRVSADCFAQANPEQERRLQQLLLGWLSAGADGLVRGRCVRALELFAGAGSLTGLILRHAVHVIAVESYPPAASQLEINHPGVAVVLEDAARAIDRLLARERPQVIVLDPPREGCAEVCRRIVPDGDLRLFYVSCDPMTLARDLEILVGRGFEVVRAQAVDMMPQTYHVEIVAELRVGSGGVRP